MPAKETDRSPSVSARNPFPGLRAFEPREHHLYFGRERQTDELMRRLRGTRFLSVVGMSGSGKSSLVRAGLVPSLHSGYMARAGSSWRVAVLRPGGDPIGNLGSALARSDVLGDTGGYAAADAGALIETTLRGSSLGLAECVRLARLGERENVLLVVDQFEELFRFKMSRSGLTRGDAVAFVKLLLAAVEEPVPLYVVLTMRSDFIGDCMAFAGLPEAINEGQYLVPRMTREELRLAITGPIGVRKARISPRLVSRLLNEVGDNPDQLPVLQHALMRTWGRWEEAGDGEVLDVSHYQAIGTMGEALSRHADKAYGELPDEHACSIAEVIFKALTEKEGEGRGVRRALPLDELCEIVGEEASAVASVVDRFRMPGRSFLTPPLSVPLEADSIIDLSHESLMRNWERLRQWTEEEAAAARVYRRLAQAARLYENREVGLWRSPELDVGLRWREETRPTAAWARRYDPDFEQAMAFLEKSARVRDEHVAQRERERRKKTRRKIWLAAIVAILLLLNGFLWSMAQEGNRLRAVSMALNVDDPLLRAQVVSEVPERLGRRLGRLVGRPMETVAGPDFDAILRAAHDLIPMAIFREPGQDPAASDSRRPPITSAALSPDGEWVVTGANDGATRLWRSDGRGDPIPLAGHGSRVASASFSRDGKRLATSSDDGTARVWSTGRGEELAVLRGHRGGVTEVAFSPRGDRLVTSSTDGTARIWSLDGAELQVLRGHEDEVSGASFSPDGDTVLTYSRDGTARIWSLDGAEPQVLRGHGDSLTGAVFSPDGDWVVTSSLDGTARIWSLDGTELQVLRAPDQAWGAVWGATFSPDGDRVLTYHSGDYTALLWSFDGTRLAELRGHQEPLTGAVFSPDGDRVVTSSYDGTARIWNLDGEELHELRGHTGALYVAAVNTPAASTRGWALSQFRIITAADDGTARVWPLEPAEPRMLGRHKHKVASVAFHPSAGDAEGGQVLTASEDGTARIWNLEGGEQGAELAGHRGAVTSAAFSPDGEEIVTASKDGTARIWKREGSGGWTEAGKIEFEAREDWVTSAAYSPDGEEIVTAWSDGMAWIWRRDGTGGWREAGKLEGHADRLTSAAYSPDGEEIVTASWDRTARIWRRDDSGGWTEVDTLEGHQESVLEAAYSPDGEEIVTASADTTARIWTREGSGGWKLKWRLKGHRSAVQSAAFSRTGREVLTASEDGTARVWSTEGGTELYALRAGEAVADATFSPDGAYVVTATQDHAVRLWRVTETALRRYLKSSTSACLTVKERCWYLGQLQWTARSRFERCEEAADRTPPADLGSCH